MSQAAGSARASSPSGISHHSDEPPPMVDVPDWARCREPRRPPAKPPSGLRVALLGPTPGVGRATGGLAATCGWLPAKTRDRAGVAAGVGSNVTQPKLSNHASTQAWASVSRTIHCLRLLE